MRQKLHVWTLEINDELEKVVADKHGHVCAYGKLNAELLIGIETLTVVNSICFFYENHQNFVATTIFCWKNLMLSLSRHYKLRKSCKLLTCLDIELTRQFVNA